MEWRDSLRANLSLWPNLTSNLAALASCAGKPWDETAFLSAIKAEASSDTETGDISADDPLLVEAELETEGTSESIERKAASTSRTVRQTIEVMVLSGLAYRDESKVFLLTPLGEQLLSFLGKGDGRQRIANSQNIHLAGRLILPGLLAVPEYRAVILLAAANDGRISTEELNRAIPIMSKWSTPDLQLIEELGQTIRTARIKENVTEIGPRWYRNEDYGTSKEGDQRKAINPWMLLAGGGGLVLESAGQAERRIHPLLLPEIPKLVNKVAATLVLPAKNIIESSKAYGMAFSNLCL